MKHLLSFTLIAALAAFMLIIATDTASAQSTQGKSTGAQKWGSFDDDGDGILNCNDPEYVRPQDGTGKKLGKTQMQKGKAGKGGNGAGGQGIGPRDGSGNTTGAGTGLCDGTGPKGKGRGR